MFGFSLKDKAKKILENDIGIYRPTSSWLNHIVRQGKPQEYNEYDVAIYFCMTEWEFNMDHALQHGDKESKKHWYKTIHSQIKLLRKIEHLAHQDLPFRARIDQIIKKSEELK